MTNPELEEKLREADPVEVVCPAGLDLVSLRSEVDLAEVPAEV